MNTQTPDSRLEARLLGAVLAFDLSKDMLTGGLWVLSDQSITGKVAQLSSYPTALAAVWGLLSLLALPYVFLQVFGLLQRYSEAITRTACRAVLASGVIWAYLGYLSKNLDYTYVTEIFIVNSLTCVAMSAVLANSLNNAQKRKQEGFE